MNSQSQIFLPLSANAPFKVARVNSVAWILCTYLVLIVLPWQREIVALID